MKMLKHLRKVWLAVLLVVFLLGYAFAGFAGVVTWIMLIGLPLVAFTGVSFVSVLFFIVYLEAAVYQRLLRIKDTLRASFVANLITTVGIVMLFNLRLRDYLSLYPLLLLYFLLTVIVEIPVCLAFFSQVGKKKLIASVIWANVLSYIVVVLMYKLLHILSVGWWLTVGLSGLIIVLTIYTCEKKGV